MNFVFQFIYPLGSSISIGFLSTLNDCCDHVFSSYFLAAMQSFSFLFIPSKCICFISALFVSFQDDSLSPSHFFPLPYTHRYIVHLPLYCFSCCVLVRIVIPACRYIMHIFVSKFSLEWFLSTHTHTTHTHIHNCIGMCISHLTANRFRLMIMRFLFPWYE